MKDSSMAKQVVRNYKHTEHTHRNVLHQKETPGALREEKLWSNDKHKPITAVSCQLLKPKRCVLSQLL
jgi:hypothetical protein